MSPERDEVFRKSLSVVKDDERGRIVDIVDGRVKMAETVDAVRSDRWFDHVMTSDGVVAGEDTTLEHVTPTGGVGRREIGRIHEIARKINPLSVLCSCLQANKNMANSLAVCNIKQQLLDIRRIVKL